MSSILHHRTVVISANLKGSDIVVAHVPHIEAVIEMHLSSVFESDDLWLRLKISSNTQKLIIVEDVDEHLLKLMHAQGLFFWPTEHEDSELWQFRALSKVAVGWDHSALELHSHIWLSATLDDQELVLFEGHIVGLDTRVQCIMAPAIDPRLTSEATR